MSTKNMKLLLWSLSFPLVLFYYHGLFRDIQYPVLVQSLVIHPHLSPIFSSHTQSCAVFPWKVPVSGKTYMLRNMVLYMAPSSKDRENEIRRKILELKRKGLIQPTSTEGSNRNDESSTNESEESQKQRKKLMQEKSFDQYADKIADKLGKKSKFLGISSSSSKKLVNPPVLGKIYSTTKVGSQQTTVMGKTNNLRNPENELNYEVDDLLQDDEDEMEDPNENWNGDEVDDPKETSLLKLVEEKLQQKLLREAAERDKLFMQSLQASSTDNLSSSSSSLGPSIDEVAEQMEREWKERTVASNATSLNPTSNTINRDSQTTTGVGGTWTKDENSTIETYRPSRGSWGYFPRPKDISRVYGGGRQVGASVRSTFEDEIRKKESEENTLELLRMYREKSGIEVQSEKDHAQDIDEALSIARRAMQRGVYNAAVSALEKVTKYCSTNSKLGGQVFLELAMAYEAVGRTKEAIAVYSTLSTSKMENIKFNAKRLLYGIEAMQFMRDEAKSSDFSRKKVSETFIDATGLANIADNFDVRYNTAYVDLDKGGNFYRKLTENVVRTVREARQILLRAYGPGEIERVKIVQALRSINRNFDDALKEEVSKKDKVNENVAIMNGIPISARIVSRDDDLTNMSNSVEDFRIQSADQMTENLDGEWRLQLMADKKGDGVVFFNSTLSWQLIDSNERAFKSSGPAGFFTVLQKGSFSVDDQQRVLSRYGVQSDGAGAFFTGFLNESSLSGAIAATNIPQQIITVDSELLITRSTFQKRMDNDNVKGYFSVWRRVKRGSYSSL